MKTMLFASMLLTLPTFAQRPVQVKPHITKKGTIVQPHVRTSPNQTRIDNYSTKGNVNPYNGKKGTESPLALPKLKKAK